MFIGIVEERGEVVERADLGDSAHLTVHAPRTTLDTAAGDSVAVNGCCLSATGIDRDAFEADVMGETLRATSLGQLRTGSAVNLEVDMVAKYVERLLVAQSRGAGTSAPGGAR